MGRFSDVKEVTTSDVSGSRMTVPPGVYYRGKVMTKHEASNRARRDFTEEQHAPRMDRIEQELDDALDVGSGT